MTFPVGRHKARGHEQAKTKAIKRGALGPAYFRGPAALIAAGPPDPAMVKKIMTRHRLVPAAWGAYQR